MSRILGAVQPDINFERSLRIVRSHLSYAIDYKG